MRAVLTGPGRPPGALASNRSFKGLSGLCAGHIQRGAGLVATGLIFSLIRGFSILLKNLMPQVTHSLSRKVGRQKASAQR